MRCSCNRVVNYLEPFEANPGQCRVCWHRLHEKALRSRTRQRRTAVSPSSSPPDESSGKSSNQNGVATVYKRYDCIHLGPVVEEKKPGCGSCATYQCNAGHGVIKQAYCFSCKDRTPHEEPTIKRYTGSFTRNLLYHIYPRDGNGVWQWNVDRLLKSISVFNGKRYAAVVVDNSTKHAPDVKKALQDHFDHVMFITNSPRLREVVTFVPLWQKVLSNTTGHITAYMHAKGVTHDNDAHINTWVNMSYDTMLGDIPFVESLLRTHALAGPFKQHGGANRYHWIYSGTFFWARNDEVAKRDWKQVEQVWIGSEIWPGGHFRREEAACIFGEGGFEYEKSIAEFEKWKSVHLMGHSAIGS